MHNESLYLGHETIRPIMVAVSSPASARSGRQLGKFQRQIPLCDVYFEPVYLLNYLYLRVPWRICYKIDMYSSYIFTANYEYV